MHCNRVQMFSVVYTCIFMVYKRNPVYTNICFYENIQSIAFYTAAGDFWQSRCSNCKICHDLKTKTYILTLGRANRK